MEISPLVRFKKINLSLKKFHKTLGCDSLVVLVLARKAGDIKSQSRVHILQSSKNKNNSDMMCNSF